MDSWCVRILFIATTSLKKRCDALPQPAKHWCSADVPWQDCVKAGGRRMMEELPTLPVPMPHWWESMQPYERVCPSCEPIWLLCPVEDTGSWDGGSALRLSSRLMLEKINRQQWLLPGYELMCDFFNNDCNAGIVQKILLWSHLNRRHHYIGIGSTGCSGSSNVLSKLTWVMNLPIVSWGSGAPDLSVRSIHRNFFRTVIPHTAFTFAWISIYKTCGWRKIALIMAEEARFRGHFEMHKEETIKAGIEVAYEYQVLQPLVQCDQVMGAIQKRRYRIIQLLTFENTWRALMCSAYSLGMRGIVWFALGVYGRGFYKVLDNPDLSQWKCGEAEIRIMADNAIYAETFMWTRSMHVPLACDSAGTMTPQSFKDDITRRFEKEFDWTTINARGGHALKIQYAPAAADGACLYALSLSVLLGLHPAGKRPPSGKTYSLREIQSGDAYEIFNQVVQNLSFNGLGSSPLKFNCESLSIDGSACDDACRNSASCTGDLSGPVEVYQFDQHGQRGVHDTLEQGTMFPRRAVFDRSFGEGKALKWYSALRFEHGSYSGESVQNLDTSPAPCVDGYGKVPGTPYCVPDDQFPTCPKGRYFDGVKCSSCELGKMLVSSSGKCEPCEPGRSGISAEDGVTRCEFCAAGTFTNISGAVGACEKCGLGAFGAGLGMSLCESCTRGFHTPDLGMTECVFCPLGKYQGNVAASQCHECHNPSYTTAFRGATSIDNCTCAKSSYLNRKEDKCTNCEKLVGYSCPGGLGLPRLADGFYGQLQGNPDARLGDPGAFSSLLVWTCQLKGNCEGVRDHNACPPNMRGYACTLCDDGYVRSADGLSCGSCAKTLGFVNFFVTVLLLCPLMFGLALVGRAHEYNAKVGDFVVAKGLASVLVTTCQTVTVSVGLLPEWPASYRGFVTYFAGFTMLDTSLAKPACAFGNSLLGKFGSSLAMPWMLTFVLIMVVLLTNLALKLKRRARAFEVNDVLNSLGYLFYALYVMVCKVTFTYLECMIQPSAPSTLVAYPWVQCGSEEHVAAMWLFIFGLLVYVFGLWALFGYVNWKAIKLFSISNNRRDWRQRCVFLVGKWVPSRWYFGQIYLTRDLLVSLVRVMDPDDGYFQINLFLIVVIVPALFCNALKPWRHSMNNAVDVFATMALVMLVVSSAGLVTVESKLEADIKARSRMCIVVYLGITLSVFFAGFGKLAYDKMRGRSIEMQEEENVQKLAVALLSFSGITSHLTKVGARMFFSDIEPVERKGFEDFYTLMDSLMLQGFVGEAMQSLGVHSSRGMRPRIKRTITPELDETADAMKQAKDMAVAHHEVSRRSQLMAMRSSSMDPPSEPESDMVYL